MRLARNALRLDDRRHEQLLLGITWVVMDAMRSLRFTEAFHVKFSMFSYSY